MRANGSEFQSVQAAAAAPCRLRRIPRQVETSALAGYCDTSGINNRIEIAEP